VLGITRRFSALGLVSVSAILASGLVNAWYLVGDVPALFGTDYGQLLLVKLALFAFMVGLASINRLALTPRLGNDRRALDALRRNALLETAAGIAIIGIVAMLGVTVPGAHQSPVWPFPETLSWEPTEDSPAVRAGVVAAAVIATAGVALALFGLRRRRLWPSIVGVAMVLFAGAGSGWLLAVPAFPTTYAASPVAYDVRSIAAGSALYAEHCSACHGAEGRGDGRLAASLSIKPIDLIEHAAHHSPGNLFWWIAHGIPETPMPAFASSLKDTEIWDLVALLQARADAQEARAMTGDAQASLRLAAPDFTFERTGQPQETLRRQRGDAVTLLVFYTVPESLPRLRALAANQAAFAAARARIIALPLGAPATATDLEPTAAPDVAGVYAMFARARGDAGASRFTHAEYIIDRAGDLRARWIGASPPAPDATAELLAQIERLAHEAPRARARPAHRH
jgi:putative copper resistance protein D